MASLSQLPIEKKLLFLKRFISEIIINIAKEIRVQQNIEKEKIKQKILAPIQKPKETFPIEIFQQSRGTKLQEESPKTLEVKAYQKINPEEGFQRRIDVGELRGELKSELRKPTLHRAKTPKTMLIPIKKQEPSQILSQKPQQQFKPSQFQPSRQPKPSEELSPQEKALREIKPEAHQRPEGFALGKIDSLLRSRDIQLIECPGPGKNLLVKRYDQINTTRIALTQEEITDILYSFAKQARIPVVGGILKVAVGDLVISAVISEFVGSRFIITKITPYSLIQNQ